jgi:hypothetical protein
MPPLFCSRAEARSTKPSILEPAGWDVGDEGWEEVSTAAGPSVRGAGIGKARGAASRKSPTKPKLEDW